MVLDIGVQTFFVGPRLDGDALSMGNTRDLVLVLKRASD